MRVTIRPPRFTMVSLLALTLLAFGTSGRAFALNEDAALALHLLPVTINGICTRAAAHPACGSIITSGRLSPSTYFAYVLITGAAAHRGLAGVEFGIDYAGAPSGGVDIFDWRHCATLQFPSDGWPGAGSGNLITWDKEAACQREEPGGAGSGVVATVGYFYLTAYTPDQLTLTVRPVSGAARIADCDAVEYPVEGPGVSHPLPHLGYVTFSADGLTPGYNPCTALTTPLTCGISGPASVPGNSRGTLYTVAASQPGATFDWQISGSGTLTVLAPGNKALVDAGGDGAFTLDVGTDGNGAHSSCRKVVTVIPGACAVNGPGTLPSGTTGQYQIGGVADGAAIQWSLFGSGTLVGPTNGSDVVVIAGTPGLMTLKAAVTVAAVTDTCSRRIEVTPGSCAVLGPDIVLAGAPGITYTAATDATGGRYSWNVVGDATVTEGGDDTPTIVLAAGESGGFTVSVTITGDGPERTCGRQVSIISAGPCQPGRNGRAKLLLNLVPAPAGAPCGRPNAAPNCSNVRTNGALFPQHYFAFLMVAQGDATYGVGGLQCGIRYQDTPGEGVRIFSWNLCATSQAPSAEWPAPGSGNRISWDVTHCQRNEPGGPATGVAAAAGYFYLAAYAPDRLIVTTFPGAGPNEVLDCTGCPSTIEDSGGSARFSAGGFEPGLNPCFVSAPVRKVTWSAIKGMYRP